MNKWLVLGMLSLLIPILVHLFRFRRYRSYYFPNIRFLKDFTLEKKNRDQLKKWLILSSRILAFSSVALAFWFANSHQNSKTLTQNFASIYIDNSRSMGANAKSFPFEIAKNTARSLIQSQGDQMSFHLIANNENTGNRFLKKQEALQWIDQLNLTDQRTTLEKIIKQQTAILLESSDKNIRIFQISDFQSSTLALNTLKIPKQIKVQLIQIPNEINDNISIDSAWLASPYAFAGKKNTLFCKIHHQGKYPIENFIVKMQRGNEGAILANVNLPSNGFTIAKFDFITPEKAERITLKIDDNNGFVFDNQFFALITPTPSISINFEGKNKPTLLTKAFQSLGFLNWTSTASANQKAQWISFNEQFNKDKWNQLLPIVENGGTMVFIPESYQLQWEAWNIFAAELAMPRPIEIKATEKITWSDKEFSQPFYQNIFSSVPKLSKLPEVSKYYSTQGSMGAANPVITLANGDPWLIESKKGKGKCYLFLGNWENGETNFPSSSLYLPIVGNLFLSDLGIGNIYSKLNSNDEAFIPYKVNNESLSDIRIQKDSQEWVPQIQQTSAGSLVQIGNYIEKTGFYQIRLSEKNTAIDAFAINISPLENDIQFGGDALELYAKNTRATFLPLGESAFSSTLIYSSNKWKWWVGAALVFFIIEMALIVFLKPLSSKTQEILTP